jgi:hypothetical protein
MDLLPVVVRGAVYQAAENGMIDTIESHTQNEKSVAYEVAVKAESKRCMASPIRAERFYETEEENEKAGIHRSNGVHRTLR